MTILADICLLLTAGYILLMLAYIGGWRRQKDFLLPQDYIPATYISIVIPARNEARNIGGCIEAILAQKYPAELFEVIVVDDHSDDGTSDIVADYADRNVRCIRLSEHLDTETIAYKKAALAVGIAQSKGSLIVTTDADCLAPNSWLLHIAAIYERDMPVMVIAPVIYTCNDSILQLFQLTDFMSMQGITAAANKLRLGNMSNGANLAFRKSAYEQAEGYKGIDHMASGDDYMLMMKLSKLFSGSVSYLKSQNAIVITTPQSDWQGLLQQRIRWASKSGKYNDIRLTLVLSLVYLFNLSLLVLLITCNFHSLSFYLFCGMLAAKIVVEYIFLLPVAKFFNNEWVLKYFPFLQPLHIVYIVLTGLLGFAGTYTWKGRKVR